MLNIVTSFTKELINPGFVKFLSPDVLSVECPISYKEMNYTPLSDVIAFCNQCRLTTHIDKTAKNKDYTVYYGRTPNGLKMNGYKNEMDVRLAFWQANKNRETAHFSTPKEKRRIPAKTTNTPKVDNKLAGGNKTNSPTGNKPKVSKPVIKKPKSPINVKPKHPIAEPVKACDETASKKPRRRTRRRKSGSKTKVECGVAA